LTIAECCFLNFDGADESTRSRKFVASTKTADANEKSPSKIKSQQTQIINPTTKI